VQVRINDDRMKSR